MKGRQSAGKIIDTIITYILGVLIIVLPVIWIPYFTDTRELPQLFSLVIVLLALYVLKIVSFFLQKELVVTKTVFLLPLGLFLSANVISALFSGAHPATFFGQWPYPHHSLLSWITYFLFFLFLLIHLWHWKQVKILLGSLIFSYSLLIFISTTSYFDILNTASFLPFESTVTTLAITLLPLCLLSTILPSKLIAPRPAMAITTLLTFSVMVTGNILSYALMLIVYGLSLSTLFLHSASFKTIRALFHTRFVGKLFLLLIPFILSLGLLVALQAPLKQKGVFLKQQQPEFAKSFMSSIRLKGLPNPISGQGPDTYAYIYPRLSEEQYPKSLNIAFNDALTLLPTLGIIGIFFYGYWLFITSKYSLVLLRRSRSLVTSAIAISSISWVVLQLCYPSNPTIMIIGLTMIGILVAVTHTEDEDKLLISSNLPIHKAIGITMLALCLFLILQTANFITADTLHAKALDQISQERTDQGYAILKEAETLNPFIDLYQSNLSQTAFVLAGKTFNQRFRLLEQSKGSQLSDDDITLLNQQVAESITHAKRAAKLNSLNPLNWSSLALLYLQLTRASEQYYQPAEQAFEQSLQINPKQIELYASYGGMYYYQKKYAQAAAIFKRGIEYFPQNANFYYNLSLTLKAQGQITQAKETALQGLSFLKEDTTEYGYLNQYIESLDQADISSTDTPSNKLPEVQLNTQLNLPTATESSSPAQ